MFDFPKTITPLSAKAAKQQLPELRRTLLQRQHALREHGKFPVIILFAGVDGAGKHETVNALNEWMDPRWLVTRAYDNPSDEERERPPHWRYWRDLPPKGQIGLFLSAWYSQPLLDHVKNQTNTDAFHAQLQRIAELEKMLTDDGALVIKFWMHLSKAEQKKRLQTLEADPYDFWQVKPTDWLHWHLYDQFIDSAKALIDHTQTNAAPWHMIDGRDEHGRALHVATIIDNAIKQRLKKRPDTPKIQHAFPITQPHLDNADLSATLSKKTYQTELRKYQRELHLLQRQANERNLSTLLVFEGWDAAGKGGAIRRISHALDARQYRVIPIAAPTDEEHAQHYLWRFWRHIPRAGRMTFFDRSWYGRVLVERVEGFAQHDEWQRAYTEINAFEKDLTDHGIVMCKFWVHIDPDEQLARFKDREKTAYKSWKLTDEDWRNRDRWDDYATAVDDMIERTSQPTAPWFVVPGNQKYYARVFILKTLCEQLKQALEKAR